MSGDEDANDLLKDGVFTRFTSTEVISNGLMARNNLPWEPSGTNNQLAVSRAIGASLSGAARYWQYLNETGASSTDVANANTVVSNLLTLVYQEPCATTGIGSGNENYPSGCTPVHDGAAPGQESRGTSAYRGEALGPVEQDNSSRCAASPGNNVVFASVYTRCIKGFMEGIYLDGLWTVAQIKTPIWSEYNKVMDLAYGVALNTEHDLYVNCGSSCPPTGNQLLYLFSFDQPNNMTWDPIVDVNGRGPPFENIYMILGQYTGDTSAWRSHFENTFINRAAGNGYNVNNLNFLEYGSQLTAEIVNLILNPPMHQLQTVSLHTSYNSATSQWTLTWTAPSGIVRYYLKEHDTKTIVDNIGWNVTTNTPIGDAAHSYNWFAAKYTVDQPATHASSITVGAPSTAQFMLKAIALPTNGHRTR